MIYEIREYTTVPGRMPASAARFRDHTLRLFERHGMALELISLTEVGEDSNNELVYVLSFESCRELQDRWAAFPADPQWQQAKLASEADGPIAARIRRRIRNSHAFERVGS